MTDQRHHIHCRSRPFERMGVVCHGRKRIGPTAAEQVHRRRGIGLERHGRKRNSAIAGDHRGYALADFRRHFRMVNDLPVIMGVGIDEARRQRQTFQVYLVLRLVTGQLTRISDRFNSVTGHQDFTSKRRSSRSVIYSGVPENGFKFHDTPVRHPVSCAVKSMPDVNHARKRLGDALSTRIRNPATGGCDFGHGREQVDRDDLTRTAHPGRGNSATKRWPESKAPHERPDMAASISNSTTARGWQQAGSMHAGTARMACADRSTDCPCMSSPLPNASRGLQGFRDVAQIGRQRNVRCGRIPCVVYTCEAKSGLEHPWHPARGSARVSGIG